MAIDLELLRREYEEAIRSLDVGFWVPKDGENLIRVLPPSPREKTKLFYRKVMVHYGVEVLGMVFCLSNWGERCPVCEFIGKLKGLNDVNAVNLGKRMVAKERYLMNIVPLNEDRLVIRQWLAPKTVRLELIRLILDKDWGDITDLRMGRNVVIERREKVGAKFPEYSVRPKPNVSAIDINENDIPSFDEILREKKMGYDEIRLGMFGEGVSEEDEAQVYLRKVYEKREGGEQVNEVKEEGGYDVKVQEDEVKKGMDKDELLSAAMKIISAYKG